MRNYQLKLSQEQLDRVIMLHERFVSGQRGGARAVLKFADLSGLDLSRRTLAGADLTGASL